MNTPSWKIKDALLNQEYCSFCIGVKIVDGIMLYDLSIYNGEDGYHNHSIITTQDISRIIEYIQRSYNEIKGG